MKQYRQGVTLFKPSDPVRASVTQWVLEEQYLGPRIQEEEEKAQLNMGTAMLCQLSLLISYRLIRITHRSAGGQG